MIRENMKVYFTLLSSLPQIATAAKYGKESTLNNHIIK